MNNSKEKFNEQIAKRLYSLTASVSKSESSQDELFKGNTWSGFESHKELDLFTLLFEFLPESTHVYHIPHTCLFSGEAKRRHCFSLELEVKMVLSYDVYAGNEYKSFVRRSNVLNSGSTSGLYVLYISTLLLIYTCIFLNF